MPSFFDLLGRAFLPLPAGPCFPYSVGSFAPSFLGKLCRAFPILLSRVVPPFPGLTGSCLSVLFRGIVPSFHYRHGCAFHSWFAGSYLPPLARQVVPSCSGLRLPYSTAQVHGRQQRLSKIGRGKEQPGAKRRRGPGVEYVRAIVPKGRSDWAKRKERSRPVIRKEGEPLRGMAEQLGRPSKQRGGNEKGEKEERSRSKVRAMPQQERATQQRGKSGLVSRKGRSKKEERAD